MTLRHRARWFHGRSGKDGAWQNDPAHPGVWLASTRQAACWYAYDSGTVVTAELRTPSVVDLNDPDTLKALVRRASLLHLEAQIRRVHARGNLYLLDDGVVQNRLVEVALRSHAGLILRDRTDGRSHLSLVVRNPEVLRVCSEQRVT